MKYYIVCNEDSGKPVILKIKDNIEDAVHYAKPISPTRNPLILTEVNKEDLEKAEVEHTKKTEERSKKNIERLKAKIIERSKKQ